MFLNIEAIRSVSCGAVKVAQEADGIYFYRMNKAQLEYYRQTSTSFYNKALTTSGIKLQFKTDSRKLRLDLTIYKPMGRSFGAVEVCVNDRRIGSINNFEGMDLSGNYAERAYPWGRQDKNFDLGEGEKTVCVQFPRLVGIVVHEIELDDGATLIPAKPEKKALVFGDSITQGFDCLWPSSHYVDWLCRALHAEEYNKAVGGEQHVPALVRCREDFTPDYIIVGFGTNDWRCAQVDEFLENCRAFYEQLHMNYPGVPVIAITPVWRADMEAVRDIIHFGPIHEIEDYIRQITAPYKNVTVVRGFEFIPEDSNMFGDLRLHPNDEGFAHYGKNLIRALRKQGLLLK